MIAKWLLAIWRAAQFCCARQFTLSCEFLFFLWRQLDQYYHQWGFACTQIHDRLLPCGRALGITWIECNTSLNINARIYVLWHELDSYARQTIKKNNDADTTLYLISVWNNNCIGFIFPCLGLLKKRRCYPTILMSRFLKQLFYDIQELFVNIWRSSMTCHTQF